MADDQITPEVPEAPEPVVEPDTPPAVEPPKPTEPPTKPADKADSWKPPTKAEWDESQKKLREVNAESASRRKKLDALETAQLSDSEKKVREAVDAANAANKPRIVKAEAKVALVGADARPERVAALTKFLDLDQIDIDGDNVTGLDDQVVKLKSEYPEFFKADKPEEPEKKTTPKIPVGNRPPADKPRTIGEQIAAMRG